ncbi:hybrid sensor histidine kinase/response regulator [Stenomitos frigidus]|uniref:histidine kinase n=1 Tax=Stenomitos frigidus ULC18 TaxID=2107698 RepID=A0A2T1ECD9_9CYAN|nr:hybrid sensor histidine kinase/response regulator [Stenomitos frigidus]PSB30419.1 hybrid sensor histidine kinase/response regulator [Stenomitos frigidus ULC18]
MQDKELEIRRQFLDEAQEYLDLLETSVLGLASSRIDMQQINAALRAAHSIKGGAGMMGFMVLSDLSHRLEDSFKVLKTQKSVEVDLDLERLLLSALDALRHVVTCDRQHLAIDDHWLNGHATPIFDQLLERLGEPQAEDAASVLSPDSDGQAVISLLFETEVEGCLQRLEAVLANPDQPCLQEELTILAQELGGLGEMLQMTTMISLCESVTYALMAAPDRVEAVAQAALQSWRQAQALVLTGNSAQLPTTIDLAALSIPPAPADNPTNNLTDVASWNEGLEDGEAHIADFETWQEEPDGFDFFPSDLQPVDVTVSDEEFVATSSVQPVSASVQPLARQAQSVHSESQVTDFRVLDANVDVNLGAEEDDSATVRVPIKQLNQLNDLLGELAIERNGLDMYVHRLRGLTHTLGRRVRTLEEANARLRSFYDQSIPRPPAEFRPLLTLSPAMESQPAHPPALHDQAAAPQSPAQIPFDSLEMDRYGKHHLLSQEMMETIVQIQEVTSDIELNLDDTEQTTRELNKTAKHLQAGLTKVRMRPLSDVVDRFPRAIRDLSLQYGKNVKLKLSGGNTMIDRNILEALNDPLMHLVRNAFDHGIEASEVRLAQDKPADGLIEIQANHRGNRTLITVRDDGAGIPVHKVRARAEQMGLDPSLLAAASDQELLSLIFEPGFSTSDHVTALSGRGVGMDVVRDKLKQVRGEITVDTQPGVGTTFTLSLPFTLSVVRVLLVESNGTLLALPVDAVSELVLLQSEQVITTAGSEVLNWGGTLVQLIRLSRWLVFNCPRQPYALESPPNINEAMVLMVSQGAQLFGLQVDRCWGEQEVAIRRIEGTLALPSGFANCTIMGDGRVVPLVNMTELLHWITSCERSGLVTAPQLPPVPSLTGDHVTEVAATPSAKILVVDDSINVRRFLALTLEKAGYRVEQAKDGQDALDKLQAGLSVQAVICDIEMPRLDGYGFLTKVKSNPALSHLPITMLTSRSGAKHRQLAMSLGATAYFSKPYNEHELLQTLEQVIEGGVRV